MPGEAANDRIEWARSHMPVLAALKRELETSRPFAEVLIGVCLHVEPKTAVLCSVLQAGGAELAITGSPGTTVDDVADALRDDGVSVYGCRDDDGAAHARNLERVMSHRPKLLLDNGADLTAPPSSPPSRSSVAPRRRQRAPTACAKILRGRSCFRLS